MSSCRNSGTGEPKIKYANRSSTRKPLKAMQAKTNHHMQAYRCPSCKSWHIGRTPWSHDYHVRMKRKKATEEYVIGRLIAALKLNLNNPQGER